MPIIDNKQQTMLKALENAIEGADCVDIQVGFFYFSGWKLLAEKLKGKKLRLLVGKSIDPNVIPELLMRIRQEGEEVDLDPYRPRHRVSSRTEAKRIYVESFVRLFNESHLFDDAASQEAYKIFESKLNDGTLEIKKTATEEHGKLYIVHNKPEFSQGGDYPGTVFMGSSNFTFQGLLNQGELNESIRDKNRYEEYGKKFAELWADSANIDITTKDNKEDFVKELKARLWIHETPSPYHVYIRVLHELFATTEGLDVATPSTITKEQYSNLEYQIDAVKSALGMLEKYDGLILADVVGLGKSIIASAIAHNLKMRSIILSPKHLVDQWENYQSEFRLPGARVYKSTILENVYEKCFDTKEPYLIVIDEAHRFRNEDTDDYKLLHHICRSHPNNKVLLLTATPFNNDPKDVFALVKLFQTPGESTIRSVDNLSLRFRDLIDRYKRLNNYRRRSPDNEHYINQEADKISIELRRLIEPVVIRRSRLDLRHITRYRQDLEKQGYEFSNVVGPELLEYPLGELSDLYTETLGKISSEDSKDSFKGTRYKPFTCIKDMQEFKKVYGEDFEEADLRTAQMNLAFFMRRLLVMRFESSQFAFQRTLKNIIESHLTIERWWNELGKVPILKKGKIPDPDVLFDSSDDDADQEVKDQLDDEDLKKLKLNKGLVAIDKKFVDPRFIDEVRADIRLLQEIHDKWYGPPAKVTEALDPKLGEVQKNITALLKENSGRKIVIFTGYADTATYLHDSLVNKRGFKRTMLYTGTDTGSKKREEVVSNFDAGLPKARQKDDYDILIATDTLSEGFNLHRAGVIINYDIPYNPTRVIQRIGRINRINKKVFENIYVYNFFPTAVGESEIRIKQISTLKIRLINSVIGSDTRTLTSEEELKSFFKDAYEKAEERIETLSWDVPFLEDYDLARKDKRLMSEVLRINPRSRVLRKPASRDATVVFGKKGDHALFALKEGGEAAKIVASEIALPCFKSRTDETGHPPDERYDESFRLVRDTLFAKHELPPVKGRRQEALRVIKFLEQTLSKARDYCRDLAHIIHKYDDIAEGHLKEITKLRVQDPEKALEHLQEIIPPHQIEVINQRVSRLEGEYEAIILSEDLRA